MKRGLASMCLLMAACATIKAAPAGTFRVENAYSVVLGQTWAVLPAMRRGDLKGSILTIDGPLLNRLQLFGGIEDGEVLLEASSKEQPTPAYRSSMTDTEIVELVTGSLTSEGLRDVKARALRPATFGTLDGVRFELDAATPLGLAMSGSVLFARKGDDLNLIVFLAPSEHYFALRTPEVGSIMGSITIL